MSIQRSKGHFGTYTASCVISSKNTEVIEIGSDALVSIQMTTVAWADADLSIHGSAVSSLEAGQFLIWGSILGGSKGSSVPSVATYETTTSKVLAIDPRLTAGCRWIQLRSSATQSTAVAVPYILGFNRTP